MQALRELGEGFEAELRAAGRLGWRHMRFSYDGKDSACPLAGLVDGGRPSPTL